MGRRKGIPADKEADGVIDGLRNGIQKGDIFCSYGFDIVNKSGYQEGEERKEKWSGEEKKRKEEAGEYQNKAKEKKGSFFNFPLKERAITFCGMMDVIRDIDNFVDDVVGSGNPPGEKK